MFCTELTCAVLCRGICTCQLPDKNANESDNASTLLERGNGIADIATRRSAPPWKLQGDPSLKLQGSASSEGIRRKSLSFNFSTNSVHAVSDGVSTRGISLSDAGSDLEVGPESADEEERNLKNPDMSGESGALEKDDAAAGVMIQIANALAKDREASSERESGCNDFRDGGGIWMSPASQDMRLRLSQLDCTISDMGTSPVKMTAIPTANARGLGLLLVRETPNSVCTVKDMQPYCVAAMDGRIQIGDQLLSVDAVPCQIRCNL